MSSFIETFTGRRFEPLAPVIRDICIEDVAHALSNQCRFSGHTKAHYSVAEHSVRVSELVEKWGHPREVQLWALLHDASEAYLVDLPSPLKTAPGFEAYRSAEHTVMHAVCMRFGLALEEPAVVRVADAVMFATEVRSLMPNRREHWTKLTQTSLPEIIVPWSHETAERNFIQRYLKVCE